MALFALCRRLNIRIIVASLVTTAALTSITAAVIAARPPGPSRRDAVIYGLHYYILNPLYLLLPIPKKAVDATALVICGTIKLAILGAAWLRSKPYRPLLLVLLSFDLLTAGSLAFARAAAGLETSVSYRYQYISLFCFGPFAGLLLSRIPVRRAAAGVLIMWAVLVTWPWGRHAVRWAQSRGIELRRAVETTAGQELLWPGPTTAGRARELIAEYNLH
jgi:hypothetical protein